jgi:hypothetical protein
MIFSLGKRRIQLFLYRHVFKPIRSYYLFFFFVALFGFSGRETIGVYGLIFPWLLLVVIFMNIPFLHFLFRGYRIKDIRVRVKHALEHALPAIDKDKHKVPEDLITWFVSARSGYGWHEDRCSILVLCDN